MFILEGVITLVDGCQGLFTRSRDYENCYKEIFSSQRRV